MYYGWFCGSKKCKNENFNEYRQVSEKFLPKAGVRTVSSEVKDRFNSTPTVKMNREINYDR